MHSPVPLHLPVEPQVGLFMAMHFLRGSSDPAGTSWQVPTEPVRLQAWQLESQLVSQQMPSTQKPLTHSVPAPQVAPFRFFPQLPMTQGIPVWHWAAVLQAL